MSSRSSRSSRFRSVFAVVLALVWSTSVSTTVRAASAEASPAEDKRKELQKKLGIKKKKAPEPDAEPEPEPEPEPDAPPAPGPDAPPGSTPEPPPSAPTGTGADAGTVYTGKIHRMLQSGCASCHKAGASAGNTKLVLTGGVSHDYRVARKLVDPKKPDKSALLTKAAGKSHMGGAPFAAGSSKYKALRAWIADGARRDAGAETTPAPVPIPGPPVATAPSSPPSTTGTPPASTPRKKASGRKPKPKTGSDPATPASAPTETPEVSPESEPGPDATPQPATPPEPTPAPAPAKATPAAPPPRVFAPDVHATLLAKCKACHGTTAPAGQGAFSLSGNAVADYEKILALVDTGAPSSSRLLTKATGKEHGGGPTLAATSAQYREILAWIEDGAHGPTIADLPKASDPAEPTETGAREDGTPVAVDATTSASPPPSTGARLGDGTPLPEQTSPNRLPFTMPFHLRLNGKFDFSYEHRNWKNHPFQKGKSAFQTYHHFLFLSRSGAEDPFGLNVELVTQAFYEFNARVAPKGKPYAFLFKGGKILVPFGNEPLFHKSYGGRSGFDQEILPIIWAQPGLAASAHVRAGPVAISNDLYTVQGFALRDETSVLNLQSDISGFDNFRAAFGDRVGLSFRSLTGWYSFQFNRLGFDRRLFMQAFDLELWRPRGAPFVEDLVFGLGGMRADVSGGGPGEDYYHFGSYASVGYFPIDAIYLQYRAGLRTTDNRRGFYYDPTRQDARDRSSHSLSILGRYKGFYAGLQFLWSLEKADEQDDDFLRITLGYEF